MSWACFTKSRRSPNRRAGLSWWRDTTGCGKSTTLAAMIEHLNANHKKHIITLEDPIEYIYEDNQCVIEQHEVGLDTLSFEHALKHVLRQDPDVIMIGEMRDSISFTGAVVAWDMPFVTPALLRRLAEGLDQADAVLPESGSRRGVEPLCAAYGPACAGAVEAALARGDQRAIGFHAGVRLSVLDDGAVRACGDPARIFFNVNTDEDLAKAEALARQP